MAPNEFRHSINWLSITFFNAGFFLARFTVSLGSLVRLYNSIELSLNLSINFQSPYRMAPLDIPPKKCGFSSG